MNFRFALVLLTFCGLIFSVLSDSKDSTLSNTTNPDAIPEDHWRFIYSPNRNCNCHGKYPQYWIVSETCNNILGAINNVPFYSANSNLHLPGGGAVYFYSEQNCPHGKAVVVDPLDDNSGKEVSMFTSDSVYAFACYCYGDNGPCRC